MNEIDLEDIEEGWYNLENVARAVYKQIKKDNIPFSITLIDRTTNFKTTSSYKNLYNFKEAMKKAEPFKYDGETGSKATKDDALFKTVKFEVFIDGGCNRKGCEEEEIESGNRKFKLYNPITDANYNNCGLKCIEKLTNVNLKYKYIKAKYELNEFDKIPINTLLAIYNDVKNEDDNELKIIDNINNAIDNEINYILFTKNHYRAITEIDEVTRDKKKINVKRGELYLDFETRKCLDKTFETAKTKTYILKDILLCAYYRDYKTNTLNKIHFITDKNKTSGKQFLDWLAIQADNKKYYNCYAHNGSNFDYFFLISQMNEEELILSDMQLRGTSVICFNYCNNRFVDTCCFLTSSLDNLCKAYKIEANKCKINNFIINGKSLTSTEICFYKPELNIVEFCNLQNTEPEFWENYVNYCYNDVIALSEIWSKFNDQYITIVKAMDVKINSNNEKMNEHRFKLDKKIIESNLLQKCKLIGATTIGGLSKKLLLNINQHGKFIAPKLNEIYNFTDNLEKYEFLNNFKIGGISHCNRPGKYESKIISFDITSQYPAAMMYLDCPAGLSYFSYENEYLGINGFYKLKNLRFATEEFKPVINKSGKIGSHNWLNKDIETTYLSNYDIDYLKKNYGLINFEVEQALLSQANKAVKGKEIFGIYIEALFEAKAEQDIYKDSKNEDLKVLYNPALRETIKLFLNSLSGKLVESVEKYFVAEFVKPDSIIKENEEVKTINGVKVIKNFDKTDGNEFNRLLPLGVMTYSYSKRLLFEYIHMLPNKSRDVVATETDSIYFEAKNEQIFINNMNNYKGSYPCKIGNELGNVKQEHLTTRTSYFLGKKFYLLGDPKGDKIVIKGIPKETINDDGSKIKLVDINLYEQIFKGETISRKFQSIKRVLYGETSMRGVIMERTIRPAFENYKLYE